MEILTHPRELTRIDLEEWRKEFVELIRRRTTRKDKDRLILAVERREFESHKKYDDWTEVFFENGKVKAKFERCSEEFDISNFERKILERNENLLNTKIERSALNEEGGEWNLDGSLEEISQGGEAVVFEEIIAGVQVAVRVQCFDSALFTGDMEKYSFNWHLSTGDFFKSLSI
jgi:hypothetical protein